MNEAQIDSEGNGSGFYAVVSKLLDKSGVRFAHYRDSNNQIVATAAWVYLDEDSEGAYFTAWSLKHPSDHGNATIGRNVAMARLTNLVHDFMYNEDFYVNITFGDEHEYFSPEDLCFITSDKDASRLFHSICGLYALSYGTIKPAFDHFREV
jgi:hypothetical protein